MMAEEETPIRAPLTHVDVDQKPRLRTIGGQKRSFWGRVHLEIPVRRSSSCSGSSDASTSGGCSARNLKRLLARRLPLLRWISAYRRSQLAGDLVGGVMAAVMNITKGTAYAQLAGIPPVNGLYALCIASLIYPLLASWSQGSMCAFAIIQLMCGAAARDVLAQAGASNGTLDGEDGEELNAAIIVSTLTFFNGLIFAAFGALRLQFLTVHFSKPLISGFLTAAALHLAAAQAGNVFGLKTPRKAEKAVGQLFRDLFSLLVRLPEANWATVGLSAVSFAVLLNAKFLLDDRIRRLAGGRKLLIPWELLLVIAVTAAVFLFDMRTEFGVQTVGRVPRGLPHVTPPRLDLLPALFQHSLAISVVQLAFHCSLAKVMSRRKGYEVDESQEVWAMSLVHVVIGFFPSFPTTNGLGRAAVIDECGATSLFTSVFTGLILIAVLLAAGPLFFWIPLCVLAVIVLVSVRGLFDGFRELPYFWRLSKWDGAVWAVTFLSSTCFDVIVGLGVGVAFQLLALATRMQWPKWTGQRSDVVCVFRFDSPLVFSNAEVFKAAVHEAAAEWEAEGGKKPERTFVFDCSAFTTFDAVGVETFGSCIADLKRTFKFAVFFVHMDEETRERLAAIQTKVDDDACFQSTEEAIEAATRRSRAAGAEESPRKDGEFGAKTTAIHSLLPPA
ncbi:Sulfate permease family protein 3 [Aphelenchoides fujianensis]|nr:Sulfate permease family protein 3 [Aphelenchoides fujianensis]